MLILGFGREGRSTLRWLRAAFPGKLLGVADRTPLEELDGETAEMIRKDSRLRLHLGPDYLANLADYDVILKSPGIPVTLPEYRAAVEAGKTITSQTALFFANAPGTIVGITGTKGKSTTASLIYAILQQGGRQVRLLGNIGVPALDVLSEALPQSKADRLLVYELSSHQLEGLRQSPHIAVLLNIVPEHLDYYEDFEQYVSAKENITRYQTTRDFLVFDADHRIPAAIASRSAAQKVGCSLGRALEDPQLTGCFISGEKILYRSLNVCEEVLAVSDVPLLGEFNLINVAAAVAVVKILGVSNSDIRAAVRSFRPLEHRLEPVGRYGGVSYYNDSISTVPEATMAALDALGESVQTVLLGGSDRGLDFSGLAQRLLRSGVKTIILFPPTGERIWQAIYEQQGVASTLPKRFLVDSMEQAVALAKQHTAQGKTCLLSPASPSFGLFRDYRERGEAFKRLVKGSGN